MPGGKRFLSVIRNDGLDGASVGGTPDERAVVDSCLNPAQLLIPFITQLHGFADVGHHLGVGGFDVEAGFAFEVLEEVGGKFFAEGVHTIYWHVIKAYVAALEDGGAEGHFGAGLAEGYYSFLLGPKIIFSFYVYAGFYVAFFIGSHFLFNGVENLQQFGLGEFCHWV